MLESALATLEAIRQSVLRLNSGPVIDAEVLAALTIWMEARGEKQEGKIAVGEVIRNRMKQGNNTAAEIVLAPSQFSCWNTKDPNRIQAMSLEKDDPKYIECLDAWRRSASTSLTKGANHYFNPAVVARPTWADPKKRVATIGSHEFYKL